MVVYGYMGKWHIPVDNFGTVVGENTDCLLLSGIVVGENPDHVCWDGNIGSLKDLKAIAYSGHGKMKMIRFIIEHLGLLRDRFQKQEVLTGW